uniref:Ig-like domain-containing protein n=1 Tax=Macrostomum lignano TaxID=282301 RepID=A0A1I8G0L0_9PLAT
MLTCITYFKLLLGTEFVTTGAGEKTWQSSSFKEYTKGPFICGIGGSQLDGAFKSADEGSAADKGYHWLAVQLRSTVWTDGFVISLTFDIAPPSNISSNTSAKVRCNVSCIDSLASIKLIHLSTNRTLATGNETYVIDSVNEEDYGVYACSVGGVVVSSGYLSVASKETKELQRPSSPELTQFYIYILMAVSSILLIAVVAGAIFACRKMAIGSHQTLERKLATVRHSTEKVSNEEPPTPDNGV